VTDVEIANAALALVKKGGIQSFEDDSAQARACKALFAPMRDKVFEDRIWSFAKGQYILDPLADAPLFGFAYQFELPGEAIAPVAVKDADGNSVAYEMFGRNICSDTERLYVVAKTKPTDASLYTPGFCVAAFTLLASFLAVPLAENAALGVSYAAQYKTLVKDAAGADGSGHSSTGARPSDLKAKRL
jgi:hypothetical protein